MQKIPNTAKGHQAFEGENIRFVATHTTASPMDAIKNILKNSSNFLYMVGIVGYIASSFSPVNLFWQRGQTSEFVRTSSLHFEQCFIVNPFFFTLGFLRLNIFQRGFRFL